MNLKKIYKTKIFKHIIVNNFNYTIKDYLSNKVKYIY